MCVSRHLQTCGNAASVCSHTVSHSSHTQCAQVCFFFDLPTRRHQEGGHSGLGHPSRVSLREWAGSQALSGLLNTSLSRCTLCHSAQWVSMVAWDRTEATKPSQLAMSWDQHPLSQSRCMAYLHDSLATTCDVGRGFYAGLALACIHDSRRGST